MEYTRVLEQLDRMVDTGRITPQEATCLRAAGDPVAFEAVMAGIRVRHAQMHTDAAVVAGSMTHDEAEAALARVRAGDHSPEVRRRIKGRGAD